MLQMLLMALSRRHFHSDRLSRGRVQSVYEEPVAPFATISAPSTANEGDDPAVSASSSNPGLSLTLQDISPVVDVSVQTGVVTPYATTYPDVTPGVRQLRFFNEANPAEFTSTANMTVTAQAPTISAPTGGASFAVGASITMTADGTADGWDINTTKVEFYVDGVLKLTVNSPTAGAWTGGWNSTGATPGTGQAVIARRYWVGAAGETGTVDSASVSIDLTGGTGPTDPLTIVTSSAARFFISGDLGITIATGVSAWADQSGNTKDAVQATPGNQPVYNATGLNGHGTVTFDGADDFVNFSTLSLPAPGTTPSWYFIIFRCATRVSGAAIFGSQNTNRHRLFWASALLMNQSCGVAGTTLARAAATWYEAEVFFNNATTDYKKIGTSSNTGVATGNNPGIANTFTLGAGSTTAGSPCTVEVACFGSWPAEPTAPEKAALVAWATAYYGASVEV